jgi:hypothetical protein
MHVFTSSQWTPLMRYAFVYVMVLQATKSIPHTFVFVGMYIWLVAFNDVFHDM